MTNLSTLFPAAATYTPAMMQYDGSSGWYSDSTVTAVGNKVTAVIRFSRASFATAEPEFMMWYDGSTNSRIFILGYASNHATGDFKGRIRAFVRNSSNVIIADLFSDETVWFDGENHTLFFSFDGDNGLATFYIDGVNADDTGNSSRVAPTTGTLDTGIGDFLIGEVTAQSKWWGGELGFIGCRDAYLTNWSDFMHPDGRPKELDESGWTEWGAQPLYWNEHGDMINNFGSAGNMTKNGTVVVGKGGN